MTPTSQKILFFGTESYSTGTLQALIDHGFEVIAVVTKPDARSGRGMKLTAPPVKQLALEHDITVWQPKKLRDIADDIRALQPITGVLVAYGKIIPQSIIDLFAPGIINIHPSLLPRYRGPSPIEATLINRDTQTGVTIMQLEAGMDSGPIYAQETLTLTGRETKKDLYEVLFGMGEQTLMHILPGIMSGALQPVAQDHSQATYCSLLTKEDSLLDPAEMTAVEAEAHVRAYLGFPRSRIIAAEHNLIVTAAHTSKNAEHALSIQFSDGLYLTIDQVIAPSGKTMNAQDYLRGNPLK